MRFVGYEKACDKVSSKVIEWGDEEERFCRSNWKSNDEFLSIRKKGS